MYCLLVCQRVTGVKVDNCGIVGYSYSDCAGCDGPHCTCNVLHYPPIPQVRRNRQPRSVSSCYLFPLLFIFVSLFVDKIMYNYDYFEVYVILCS